MSDQSLGTPADAKDFLARLFSASQTCDLSVREDKAFKGNDWLPLGKIRLFPYKPLEENLLLAVERGAFEWKLPPLVETQTTLGELLVNQSKEAAKKASKLERITDAVAASVARTGLIIPRFDPHSISEMPFRRPTSIVVDTSGVSQGALDFVASFLHPTARIKVPAIVQMEIVNFGQRFISNRRAATPKGPDLLLDHVVSQGSQRVLLRLELHSDVEIERTFLLGDPLRSAFTHDNDGDVKELNLTTEVPLYSDRLILETARQHQAQVSRGHQVRLLTSDQALARVALAEGIAPLFFSAVKGDEVLGKRLSGTTFHPFTGELHSTSLSKVLWELATSFGSARLVSEDQTEFVRVDAIGGDLSWSPYHSKADMLWISAVVREWKNGEKAAPKPGEKPNASLSAPKTKARLVRPVSRPVPVPVARDRITAEPGLGWYQFKPQALLNLVDELESRETLSEDEVAAAVGSNSKSGTKEYKRFLSSGHLIASDGNQISATRQLRELAVALRHGDVIGIRAGLTAVPSYDRFEDSLKDTPTGKVWDSSIINRGVTSYTVLGEITQVGSPIAGEGYYPTFFTPTAEEFAPRAVAAFAKLDTGEGLVSVGSWLESLIRDEGIHPVVARSKLAEASAKGLLRRSTEGSTTDTRHDDHTIAVLVSERARPTILRMHLYRGGFLIPGKSSTSIRIGPT